MSYSDIVGSISGLLQFVVACYALRVSRVFGFARVGWVFFGAFSLLALVHVLLSVEPFGIKIPLGPSVNTLYEIISALLLANIAQIEFALWKRRQQQKSQEQSRAESETKAQQQVAELTKAHEELQRSSAGLLAEVTQHKQALEQQQEERAATEQTAKSLQEQLATLQRSEDELRVITVSLQGELDREKQLIQQTEKSYQEQLAALQQSEEKSRALIATFETELARRNQSQTEQHETQSQAEQVEQVEKMYQEQLAAARQSEEQLRNIVAALQSKIVEQQQKVEQTETVCRDVLTSVRQSGIAEVATLAQSRVAYITRLNNLMREHNNDLGKFMTRNRRGKQLPDSFALLLDYLSDEQSLIVNRMLSVKRKLDQVQPAMAIVSVAETPAMISATSSRPEAPGDSSASNEAQVQSPPVPHFGPPEAESGMAAHEQGTADFQEHLIDNLTQTGTEQVNEDQEESILRAAGALVPDTSEFRSPV